MRKLAATMIIPTKPFKRRLPADCVFEISPPEKKYSQPAMMMLKKKTRPAIRNMKSMRLKPPPVRRSEILLSLLILVAGLSILSKMLM